MTDRRRRRILRDMRFWRLAFKGSTFSRATADCGKPVPEARRLTWWQRVAAMFVAVVLGVLPTHAADRITLGPGDTVSVIYSGIGPIVSNVAVDEAGMLHLEWVGTYPASGQTILEMQETVKTTLDGRVFRHLNQAGEMEFLPVTADDIWLRVDAWRGVTVYGSVMEPGEYPYRRDLSVRALVGIAGGMRIAPAFTERAPSPLQRLELQERYFDAATRHARLTLRLWDIDRRLNPEAAPSTPLATELGITKLALSSLIEERQQAAALYFETIENQKAFLNTAVNQARARVEILRDQRSSQSKTVAAEEEEEARVKDLVDRNLALERLLVEARRATFFSVARLLEIEDRLNRAEQLVSQRTRDVSSFEENRLLTLLEERQDVRGEHLIAKERMDRLSEGLGQMAALAGYQPSADAPPEIILHRQQDGRVQALQVDLDTRVRPGDIVEVRLYPVTWAITE